MPHWRRVPPEPVDPETGRVCHPVPIAPLLVAEVGLDARTAGAQAVYTYLASPDVSVGEARLVPLGPRRVLGYVLALREVDAAALGFPVEQLKALGPRVEGLGLPEPTLALIHEVARQTLSPVSLALGLAAPPGTRDRLVTTWEPTGAEPGETPLTTAQAEALRVLTEVGCLQDTKAKPIPQGSRSALRALERRGLARRGVRLAPRTERQRLSGLLRLTADTAKVEAFLRGPGKRKPAQAVTLMRLQGSESAAFSVEEVRALGGVTDQIVQALVAAGLLETVEAAAAPVRATHTPNPHQRAAIEAIVEAVQARRAERFLLFGVTGSGKTEVYLRAAAEALKAGRQVLYLVPEIALTAQVVAQLRERFGGRVAVVHSNMSPGERLESWTRVRRGETPVVLGARSALFAPFTDLGLIVLDEEHEGSYKQDAAPRYHAKRLAAFLAGQFSCPLVLGSATPSVESFHDAEAGRVRLLRLPERAASARLPGVEVVDLTELYRTFKPSILSPRLSDLLGETLGRGEQAILFLNRRAYSPFLVCRDCGHRFLCHQCAVALAYHRKENRLRCHHCGEQHPVPDVCPQCEGTRVAPFGVGAEKVEEAVGLAFPSARVARLDRDVARRVGALEETLTAFRSGALDVLVGTQMVAKGLDFPNVTLVGVIAADVSLNVPDFRASERTFQLLSQVAGRAGRGRAPGTVVVQTLNPTHTAVLSAQRHDFEGFYQEVMAEREEAGYPPCRRLVNVLFTGEDRAGVFGLSAVAAQRLRLGLDGGAEVLGPADCPVERVQNLWRRHVLVKLPPDGDPGPIQSILESVETGKARIVVDVDPGSLM